MAGIVRSGDGWPGRLLVQAGRLHLLAQAWLRFDDLPPALQADLRTVAGWSWTGEEVLAAATPVRDHWQVVGTAVVEEERFRISGASRPRRRWCPSPRTRLASSTGCGCGPR